MVLDARSFVSFESNLSALYTKTSGFQDIDGERRFTQHMRFMGPNSEVIESLVVYTFGTHATYVLQALRAD